MLAVSAGAWYLILGPRGANQCACGMSGAGFDGSSMAAWMRSLGEWVVMTLAMMLPLMATPARFAAFSSLWRRRHQAVGTFLVAYVAVWAVAGAATLGIIDFLHRAHVSSGGWVAGAGFLATAAFQFTPLKRRLAVACHRTRPLAPHGWSAHRDCLLFGLDHGVQCVPNCWLLMVAAMLSPWGNAMMMVATLLLVYERYRARPRNRVVPAILGLLAAAHFTVY